jgi:hypothetical protein
MRSNQKNGKSENEVEKELYFASVASQILKRVRATAMGEGRRTPNHSDREVFPFREQKIEYSWIRENRDRWRL